MFAIWFFTLQTKANYRLADKMHMDKSELISAETIYLIIIALIELQLTSTILYYGILEKKKLFDNTNLWLMQQQARVNFALDVSHRNTCYGSLHCL